MSHLLLSVSDSSLHSLPDDELIERLKSLAREERRITHEVLRLLREVSRRRLHLKRGFDSVFTFLVKELGYDPSAAQLRSNALGVLEALPEIKERLEEGKLSVTTVAQAETFFKREAKRHHVPCSVERKKEILLKLEGCSKREAERVLAGEAPEAPRPDRVRAISEERTEIRFTADHELLGLLKQVRELGGHREREEGLNGLLKFMARIVIRQLDPARAPVRGGRERCGQGEGKVYGKWTRSSGGSA